MIVHRQIPSEASGAILVHRARRGRKAFHTPADYSAYLRILQKHKNDFGVALYAFCLLPDSVYLVVAPARRAALARYMDRVTRDYCPFQPPARRPNKSVFVNHFVLTPLLFNQDLFFCIKMVEFLPVQKLLSLSPVQYPWSSCTYRVLEQSGGILDTQIPETRFYQSCPADENQPKISKREGPGLCEFI